MKRKEQTMNTLCEQYCLCLTKSSLMCNWTCCRWNDPSLCMCPAWPWFCIHYPWIEATRTLEFKEAPSFWHLAVFSSNCVALWNVLQSNFCFMRCQQTHTAKHNARNITVSRDTKVTCCVDVMYKLCQPYTHESIQSCGRIVAWLWMAGVWGVDRYDGAGCYALF